MRRCHLHLTMSRTIPRITPLRLGLAAIGLAVLGGGIVGVVSGRAIDAAPQSPSSRAGGPPRVAAAKPGPSLADRLQLMRGGIVEIVLGAGPWDSGLGQFAEPGFPPGGASTPSQPTTTGFVVDPDGLVLTVLDAIGDAETVTVRLADGRVLDGRVIGRDRETGLGLLRIESDVPLQALAWTEGDAAEIGDDVYAIRLGDGRHAAAQILSIPDRQAGSGRYSRLIQLSAGQAAPPAGTPLFNASGRVIGIYVRPPRPAGDGPVAQLAVPASIAQAFVRTAAAPALAAPVRIGVALQALTAETAEQAGLWSSQGALVAQVDRDSPAEYAGLAPGDAIVAVDGRPVSAPAQVVTAVAQATGREIVLSIVRDGRTADLPVETWRAAE